MLERLPKLCRRLESLIDDLLRYSRLGRVDLAIQKTDLNHVVNEVLDRLRIGLNENHINIQLTGQLPELNCDRSRVGEIFSNLVSNAVKYNDKEEKQIEIGYSGNFPKDGEKKRGFRKEWDYPFFYVQDNGIGIKEQHLDRIFTIFKRLHGRDKYGGGTGAGLTIAKKIVERHGGKIWAESALNQGTTFFFTLPGGNDVN
jgi:light-regulated signal transduction histidine kinase (bacteriophytochrome)